MTPQRSSPADFQKENESLRARIVELEREIEEMRHRLSEEQSASEALRSGQVDAIVDRSGGGALLLRAAQAALRESEERYRTIVTTTDEGIWTADANMVTTFANERVASMLDYTVPEMIGRSAEDFLAPSARAEARRGFERRRQGVAERREMELLRKDGTTLWASVNASPVMGSDGTFAGSLVMGTDITEKRRLEEARRSTEERFARVFEASPIPIAITTSNGDILEVNGRSTEFSGYSRAELVGHNAEDLGLWADPADRQRLVDVMSADGRAIGFEATFRRKSGETRDVLLSMESIALRDVGEPVRILMFIDVTDRKRTEQQLRDAVGLLRESEERIGFTLRSANVGIWDMDFGTGAAQWSEILEAQYGLQPGTFAGTFEAFVERIHPDDRSLVRAAVENVLKSGGDFSVEHRAIRPDGTVHTMNNIGHVSLGEHGAARAVGISIDITDKRRLEEQFRQSQKMEAVGRLAGGVAHDFNNLLTVMFGYGEVLLQGLEPGPLREAAEEVQRAGERAATLTRQLLAFSRRQTLIPEVLDLGEVVNGLSNLVERLIGEEIKVKVVVPPNLGRVKADRGQMEQVVMNLAVNARDAMPKGGSLILELANVELDGAFAYTHAEVEAGSYVLLAISDTGTGMDAETQKRIFEPFFTTKEAGKGTGLGLSTVHGIVHQSGGEIGVYSEPGRGTTFKIYLPRVAGDAAVRRPSSGVRPALRAGFETILVVEDEAAIRQLTNLILQKAGYTVLLAEGPADAEQISGSHAGPIHLLLTDVVMPGVRGPELAERLLRQRPDLLVLYMSGYTDDAIAHHGLLEAGVEFLQKPFTPLGLTNKVREVLGSSKS